MRSLNNLIARLEGAGIPVVCEAVGWLGEVKLRFGHKWVEAVRKFRELGREVERVYYKLPKPHRRDAKLRELRKKLFDLKSNLSASSLMVLLDMSSAEKALEKIARLKKEFEEVVNDEAVRDAIAEHAVSSRLSERG
jgi:transposase